MNEAWNSEGPDDELSEEYDFTPEQLRGAARGKYIHRYEGDTNLIVLEPMWPKSSLVQKRSTRRLRALIPIVLGACIGASPLATQTSSEAEVREVVDRLFAGIRAGDSTVVRSTLHPEARLQTTAIRQGQSQLRTDSIDAFIHAIGSPHAEVWDERISNVEISVDGPLATAWMDYTFTWGSGSVTAGSTRFSSSEAMTAGR